MERNILLIVDGAAGDRAALRAIFEDESNILEAENGEQALMMIRQCGQTLSGVLLNVDLPGKTGFEVLEEMKRERLLTVLPVILTTGRNLPEEEARAFDMGAADIIEKSLEPYVIRRRVENIVELNRHKLHLEELVEEQADELQESQNVLIDALTSVIEYRSMESGQHVLRIRMFTQILLEAAMRSYPEYGLDRRVIKVISSAASLHDIGKIAIPDAVLNKPGRLTAEEFEIMKTHAEKGADIISSFGRMQDKEYQLYAYNICRYHHERWDGKGYPEGLKGENIPLCAQVVGIADAYDALTSDRVYKKAFSPEKAFSMILNGECGAFPPQLLELLKDVSPQFAELTREYADGLSPRAAFDGQESAPRFQPERSAAEQGLMKYFAMLRYEDSTVVEADLNTGVYHMVYQRNRDFDALRSGSLFDESYRAFMDTCVHPDDRDPVPLFQRLEAFLERGALKKTVRYRVLHQDTGAYIRYEMTALRINMKDPHQRKLLLVWRQLDQLSAAAADGGQATELDSSGICLLRCRVDRCFTLLRVNPGFTKLLGYTQEDLDSFGGRFIEIIHKEDRAEVSRRFFEQLSSGDFAEIEYRVITKAGRTLWVLDRTQVVLGEDGEEYMNCVLIDFTQARERQEELRLSMERHQIIMDQTTDILFEWDIQKDTVTFSANWVNKFGYEPMTKDFRSKLPTVSHIMPEDLPGVLKILDELRAGAQYRKTDARIADSKGRYLWCQIRLTAQFNGDGEAVKAVGVVLDIDEQRRFTQSLREQADRDSLTWLYNRDAARRCIEWRLAEKNAAGVLMILDLNGFARINSRYGHMYGDTVLVEVANRLKDWAGPEDVLARIGGDEFMAYIPGLTDEGQIAARIGAVMERVCRENEVLRSGVLACTVGAARFPRDAESFQELFCCCDQAFCVARGRGENQFFLYDRQTVAQCAGKDGSRCVEMSTRIDSDASLDFEAAVLPRQIFHTISREEDMDKAMASVLKTIGQRYQASRAYIFEELEDGSGMRNVFEWCAEGVAPQLERQHQALYAEVGDYMENFDANGVFYCTDINSLPPRQRERMIERGVSSTLQCGIFDHGKICGMVGFDDCTGKRQWSREQIGTLTYMSELLSMGFIKWRAQDEVKEMFENMRTLLDTQNAWIYVIDPKTYELRYINARTYRLIPAARVGMACHEAFFNRKTPCEDCPARSIRQTVNKTQKIYNPLAKVWTEADASLIKWAGQEACLLVCRDITDFMQRRDDAGETAETPE